MPKCPSCLPLGRRWRVSGRVSIDSDSDWFEEDEANSTHPGPTPRPEQSDQSDQLVDRSDLVGPATHRSDPADGPTDRSIERSNSRSMDRLDRCAHQQVGSQVGSRSPVSLAVDFFNSHDLSPEAIEKLKRMPLAWSYLNKSVPEIKAARLIMASKNSVGFTPRPASQPTSQPNEVRLASWQISSPIGPHLPCSTAHQLVGEKIPTQLAAAQQVGQCQTTGQPIDDFAVILRPEAVGGCWAFSAHLVLVNQLNESDRTSNESNRTSNETVRTSNELSKRVNQSNNESVRTSCETSEPTAKLVNYPQEPIRGSSLPVVNCPQDNPKEQTTQLVSTSRQPGGEQLNNTEIISSQLNKAELIPSDSQFTPQLALKSSLFGTRYLGFTAPWHLTIPAQEQRELNALMMKILAANGVTATGEREEIGANKEIDLNKEVGANQDVGAKLVTRRGNLSTLSTISEGGGPEEDYETCLARVALTLDDLVCADSKGGHRGMYEEVMRRVERRNRFGDMSDIPLLF